MKKRILSFFLAVLMVMSCFGTLAISAAEYTDPTLAVECSDIGDAELGLAADEVRVDIYMYNNPGISALRYNLAFNKEHVTPDRAVGTEEYKNPNKPELGTKFVLTTDLASTPTLQINDPKVDLEAIDKLGFTLAQQDNFYEEGLVVGYIFKVTGEFEETEFKITDDNITQTNDETFEITDYDGFTFVSDTCGLPKIEGVTLTGDSIVYDGTEKNLKVEGNTSGMTVTYTAAVKNVGKHEVVATVKKAGYATLTLKATLEITPKNLTIEGIKVNDKVFDNTTDAVVDYTNAALVGVCAGDTVTFTKPTPAFPDANVGTNKAMTMEAIKLDGASAANYTLTQPALKGVIIEKVYTIVPTHGQGHKVGATQPAITYTIKDGETVISGYEIKGALSIGGATAVGEYPIAMGDLHVEPNNGNIKLVLADEIYTIFDKDPQSATVTVPESAIYGTTGLKVKVTDHVGVASPVITFTSSNEDVVKVDADGIITVIGVGKADITVTIAGDDTYAPFIAVNTIEIKGKPVTVTPAAGQTSVYGDKITITYTASEDITFTGALAIGSTDAGVHNILLGTLAAKNYEITLAPATYEITKKTVNVTGVELWPTQNPEINMNTFKPAVAGAIEGDDVTVNVGIITIGAPAAGLCTITGLTLGGADAANYNLVATVAYTYVDDQTAADAVADEVQDIIDSATTDPVKDIGTDMTVDAIKDQLVENLGLTLPAGATIEFVSADPAEAVDADGNVVRGEEDTDVTFTFNIKTAEGMTSPITVAVTVVSSEDEDRLLALYYYFMMLQMKKNTVIAPVASVASGEVVSGTKVTLTTETAGATIYYTTDGTTPTTASTVYTAPIAITEATTIKAIAVKAGMKDSGVVKFSYTAAKATTTITLKADASQIKYLPGYADGTFKPTQDATRYEVIVALNNIFDIKTNGIAIEFSDVSSDMKALVDKFTAAGIISGYPDGTFRGDKTIERGEFATMIAQILKLNVEDAKDAGFKDMKGHWAAAYVNACAAAELVYGKSADRFDPDTNIKRGELAALLNRVTGAKAGTTCTYKDVPADAWYFGDVAAAAK